MTKGVLENSRTPLFYFIYLDYNLYYNKNNYLYNNFLFHQAHALWKAKTKLQLLKVIAMKGHSLNHLMQHQSFVER